MQTLLYKSGFMALSFVVLAGCKPKFTEPTPDKGSIDVSKYVSIGNSITSGFADAALYYDGQQVSYPNLLAGQLKLIGGGEFKQPLVPMSSVGIGSSLNARLVLGYSTDCATGQKALGPVSLAPAGDLSIWTTNIAAQGPFNNMGVPGAKAINVGAAGYGSFNPFFGRMISSGSVSMLSEAAAQNPTFFSLFIGNNDVLGYASAGGASDAITPSMGPVNVGFDASIDQIVSTMTANGAKGIIGNVPDITNLPYFTTIPYNGLVLTVAQAVQLNQAYAMLGITFKEGANPFLMEDSSLPGGTRPMKPGELVLITTPQDSLKCGGWGSQKPLKDQYVLSQAEISNIQNAVIAYNTKLKAVASASGLAFVDVNAFMAKCKTGIVYNGIAINTTFVSGGAFSLDGIHLTPLGNAMLANEFIKAINTKYGSSIPQVDASKYHGVVFP